MDQTKRRIDRILEDAYLDALDDRPIAEVRSMRAECAEEEAVLSYERRLLHGRLDLLRFELDRRAGKATGSLVDNLKAILTDEQHPSRGAFPGADPKLERFHEPHRKVTRLLGDDIMRRLPELSDEDLRTHIGRLEEVEQEISATRASILRVLDELTSEIGRRYRSGEADPRDVLSSP
ncbi:MAG TPA: hypothetical protein VGB83_08435 [Actinomycetota bacterium]